MAELFDIIIRRQIYVEGLKAAKAGEFAAVLAKLKNDLTNRLQGFEFPDLGDATKTALRSLIVDLRSIAKTIFDPFLTSLIDWLQRFVAVDRDLLIKLFNDAKPQSAADLQDSPDQAVLWANATNAPMATGSLPLPLIAALLPSLYVKFERLVYQHYAQNATKAELIAAIVGPANSQDAQGLLKQLNAQSTATIATVLQHLASQNSEALGQLVAGYYEWVSVLDNRTTLYCLQHDGNRYAYGKGPIPPAHFNCRSTIVPVGLNDPKTPDSFGVWLSGQPGAFVEDALDGRRTDLYERAKPITLNDYGAKGPLIGA